MPALYKLKYLKYIIYNKVNNFHIKYVKYLICRIQTVIRYTIR